METGEERERENELSFAPSGKSVFNSTDHHLLHFLPPAEA